MYSILKKKIVYTNRFYVYRKIMFYTYKKVVKLFGYCVCVHFANTVQSIGPTVGTLWATDHSC